jgi:hypothetical protein
MFKPHYGICVCHNKERLIVVKSGLCKIGNDEKKGINRTENNRFRRTTEDDVIRVGFIKRKGSGYRTGDRQSNKSHKLQRKKTSILDAPKIKKAIKKRSKIKYVRRATGEAKVFIKIFEESLQANEHEGCYCRVCAEPLGREPYTWMFSHVLAKGSFPVFRLWPRNIWICCLQHHSQWDQGDKSTDDFSGKRDLAAKLKQFYYWLTHKNRTTSDPDELEMYFKMFENEKH